ncbi:hypothetical protein EDD22DRAFT_1002753 [Suillus occidentalis]|nr:hypothetical protein EDD22DRAFT_1002753 [Suillus occidentalis]
MASASANLVSQAVSSGELTDLVSSSTHATTRSTNLVVVQSLPNTRQRHDANAKEYEERCYKDTKLGLADSRRPPQPHLYEQAAKIYLLMRRRNESQAVVTRGISGRERPQAVACSWEQICAPFQLTPKREAKIVEQIKSFTLLLESFGNAKTPVNPNASRHTRYTESSTSMIAAYQRCEGYRLWA